MEQPKVPTMEILQVCKITPSSPTAEFSLPLTFFDLMFFPSPPAQRLLFYSFAADQPELDSILQNLQHSLSLTLSHFLPLAGNLVWSNHSPEPFIRYKHGDSVSLTIAKTDADFDHLSSNHVRQKNESHFLVPNLPTSDNNNVAPAMALQITLFPNTGLSIGIITNHVVTDGKTSTMFLKSWAFICSTLENTLPAELTPVFDRTAANNPTGLQSLYVKYSPGFISTPKMFRFPPKPTISDEVVSGTFELTLADIETLRRKVEANSMTSSSSTHRRLSTFVLTFAHVSTCLIKAQRIDPKCKIGLTFPVDWRPRVGTLGGHNYFGNGVSGYGLFFEAREFEEENAMAVVSKKISDGIGEIEENSTEDKFVAMSEELIVRWGKEKPVSQTITVGGSPRFGVYNIDFGWGGCKKVEMVSMTPGRSFSLAESRNGNGNGVEVGVVLPCEEAMDNFCSLFFEVLNKKNHVN